jgi:hypothetical protein
MSPSIDWLVPPALINLGKTDFIYFFQALIRSNDLERLHQRDGVLESEEVFVV